MIVLANENKRFINEANFANYLLWRFKMIKSEYRNKNKGGIIKHGEKNIRDITLSLKINKQDERQESVKMDYKEEIIKAIKEIKNPIYIKYIYDLIFCFKKKWGI